MKFSSIYISLLFCVFVLLFNCKTLSATCNSNDSSFIVLNNSVKINVQELTIGQVAELLNLFDIKFEHTYSTRKINSKTFVSFYIANGFEIKIKSEIPLEFFDYLTSNGYPIWERIYTCKVVEISFFSGSNFLSNKVIIQKYGQSYLINPYLN